MKGTWRVLLSAAAVIQLADGFGLLPGLHSPNVFRGNAMAKKLSQSDSRHQLAARGRRLMLPMRAPSRVSLLALSMSTDDVSSWTTAQVVAWLEQEGFNQDWQKAFQDNEIDGEALKLMKDPTLLDDMGIPKMVGGRLKFWQKLDVVVPSSEPRYGSGTVSRIVEDPPAEDPPVTAEAVSSAAASLIEPVSVDEAAKVAGAALSTPMDGSSLGSLMADEDKFIDEMCQLLATLDAKDRDVALLLDMKDRMKNLFSVVIVGEFNAGKSSLINAILGSRFCQEGVVPTTTTINMLRYGEGSESGQIQRNKDYMELFLPVPLLKQVTVVDTPGTNAIIKEQTRLTKGFIPQVSRCA
jgi:hypothetical protein